MGFLARKTLVFSILTLFFVVSAFAVSDQELLFSSGSTQTFEMSFTVGQISGFSFNITGELYNSNTPSNITVDIADDGSDEWIWEVYHSYDIESANQVLTAYSNIIDTDRLWIVSDMNESDYGDSFGYVDTNIFYPASNQFSGTLGFTTVYDFDAQTISIVTDTKTVHAFLPAMDPISGRADFYIAKGGSTYYCNSNHDLVLTSSCNLTIVQALNDTHLARQANQTNFNISERVTNPDMVDIINSELSGCGLPCNVTVSVSTDTAGNLSFTDFSVVPAGNPAIITITDAGSDYHVDITPNLSLTSVEYFYGYMPNVYVVPFIANDDSPSLSANQRTRLNLINDSLVSSWDSLTDGKLPLNFTVYTSPVKIPTYNMGENNYTGEALESFAPLMDNSSANIVIILDVHDYYPAANASNMITTHRETDGLINRIYVNGFSDSNPKTNLYNWDSELLLNVVLHELAHSFVNYPYKDRLFYVGHPSSFNSLPGFDTRPTGDSPTSSQGYYEIYSILNQLRPYIAQTDISNTQINLSIIDRMLMATMSPYTVANYTYYNASVTDVGSRHQTSSIVADNFVDVSELYFLAPLHTGNPNWYNVLDWSTPTSAGVSTSFDVSKAAQNGRALWVFANDGAHPGHFAVYGVGTSAQTSKAQMRFFMDWNHWDNTTTNFSAYNTIELTNLSGARFSNNNGKIEFSNPLILNTERTLIGKVRVFARRIYINSSIIPEFNRPAKLTFQNISFVNPQVYRDGSNCSSSICTSRIYNGTANTFTCNVTGFSEYTIIEGPYCSNGVRDGTDQCDGTDFGPFTCSSYGFNTGSLTCTGSCTIDNSGCSNTGGGGGGGGGGGSSSDDDDGPSANDNLTSTSTIDTGSIFPVVPTSDIAPNESLSDVTTGGVPLNVGTSQELVVGESSMLMFILLSAGISLAVIIVIIVVVVARKDGGVKKVVNGRSRPMEKVDVYIEHVRANGHTDEQIRKKLLSVGWDKKTVETELKRVKKDK
ncbi:hypothetical protein GOV04_00515 [Candidatus Woesearchaeota archaeon]|nr:hypothetical protein [Candidatus Woesearchaeota archaeon]